MTQSLAVDTSNRGPYRRYSVTGMTGEGDAVESGHGADHPVRMAATTYGLCALPTGMSGESAATVGYPTPDERNRPHKGHAG